MGLKDKFGRGDFKVLRKTYSESHEAFTYQDAHVIFKIFLHIMHNNTAFILKHFDQRIKKDYIEQIDIFSSFTFINKVQY